MGLSMSSLDDKSEGSTDTPVEKKECRAVALGPPLCTQPELIRDLIASFLHTKEMQRLMAANPGLLNSYGAHLKRLQLQRPCGWQEPLYHPYPIPYHAIIISSLLSRYPHVKEISLMDTWSIIGLAHAINSGCCTELHTLGVVLYDANKSIDKMGLYVEQQMGGTFLSRLFWNWRRMEEYFDGDPILHLGLAIETQRLKGIKVLKVKSRGLHTTGIAHLFHALVFDHLEELHLDDDYHESQAMADVVAWLRIRHAPHLLVFTGISSIHVANALASSSNEPMAPNLQVLGLKAGYESLINAIHRGAWPELRELTIECHYTGLQFASTLMQAVDQGARGLRVLRLVTVSSMSNMMLAVANVLERQWCPGLEELDLSVKNTGSVTIDDQTAVAKLAASLQVSNNNLVRLRLAGCGIDTGGMKHLYQAFINGACPSLEVLDLSHNQSLQEEGVRYLIWTLNDETVGGKPALPALRELIVEGVDMKYYLKDELCQVCDQRSVRID